VRFCVEEVRNGICGQTALDGERCGYHQKLHEGRIEERVDELLSEEELEATMNGRAHRDGRRLDQYVLTDR
jgi:hypothetical protein